MTTPPRQLAGSSLHAEALRSARHYGDPSTAAAYPSSWPSWGAPPPSGDMPYGAVPPAGEAAFGRADLEHFCREGFAVLRGFYSGGEVEALRLATCETLSRLGQPRARLPFEPVYAVYAV